MTGCGSGGGDTELITDESGIKYADLVEGTGERCELGDTVLVGYTMRLRNGIIASTSEDGSGPIPVKLGAGAIIKGWDRGIPGMKVGGVRKLVIPAELGFGDNPRPKIPPKSELTAEIKLLEILNKAPHRAKKSDGSQATNEQKKA